jgi:hypothetical protein
VQTDLKTEPRSSRMRSADELLAADNGRRHPLLQLRPLAPSLSRSIYSWPSVSNPTVEDVPYPFVGHFAKESPKDIDFAPQSSAREKIKEFLYLFKFV